MRRYLAALVGLLLTLVLTSSHIASSDAGVTIPVTTVAGVAATIALGIEDPVGLLTSQQSGTTTTYSDGTYQIQITETATKARSIVRVIVKKVSGDAFRMNNFSISVRVPRKSIEGIWYPGAEPSSQNTMV